MDVTSEYYRIFGRVERPNIFTPVDEEYYSLWQSVMDSNKEDYDYNKLPFDNIKLFSFDELETIRKEEQNRNRILLNILDALIDDASVDDNSVDKSFHAFYINRNMNSRVLCDAIGRYDKCSKTFVLMAGSILLSTPTYTFAHSESGIRRASFLNKFCVFENSAYRLKKDYTCQSPSAAATLVLGRSANGWTEWKDEDRRTLDDVYRNTQF